MKHLINHLTFEIHCPSEHDALGLRHNFAQTLQKEMESGIDKIFSKYIDQNQTIRINKLELDLGHFNRHTFDRHVMGVFLDKFERALLKELAEVPFTDRENTSAYSQFEALINFLETGQRVWWKSTEEPDFNLWFLSYFEENQSLFLDFLKSNSSNGRIWRRIAFQLNSEIHKTLVDKIANLKMAADWMGKHIAEVLNDQPQASLKQLLNKLVIANNAQLIQSDTISISSLKLLASHIKKTDNNGASNQKILKQQIEILLAKEWHEIYNDSFSEPSNQKILKQQIETLLAKESREIYNDSLIVESSEKKIEKSGREKFLSNHGGAVLLSQFLKPLFKNLGLYQDGEWKDNRSRFKAVLLINYLCTGEDSAFEYKLNIEKLLCGLPLNAPVPFEADLTEAEMHEATLLLESIIEHWGALKNTSIQGLRDAFLLRDCIISKDGMHWQINIERKTVDVLLDKLPWGFSLIILPWNNHQIHVSW